MTSTSSSATKPGLRDPEELLTHDAFVQGLARRLVEDEESARDLVQDTWVAAIEGAPERPGSLRAWLARVVRYLAAKGRRAEVRRKRRDLAAARANHIPSTAEIVEREAARRRVVQAVLELREPYRTTMLLRFFENLPPREVARRLEVPVETVRTRVRRALDTLRAQLDSQHGGERRAWCLMLLPLVPRPTTAAALGSVGGTLLSVLIMTTKAKLAAVAALCGVIFAALWALQDPSAEDGGTPPGQEQTGRMVADPIRGKEDPTLADTQNKERQGVPVRESMPAPTRGSLLVRAVWQDDKQPAVGVLLKAMILGEGDYLFDAVHGTTDDTGTCLFEDLKPRRMYVEAMRGGMGRYANSEVVAGKQTEVRFEILQGVNVKGVVVSKSGDPIAGADVIVAPWAGGQALAIAKTDGEGRFALRSITTHCHLGARAKGHAPSLMHTIIGSKGGNLEVRLVLGGPGGWLEGRVLDPRGQGVEGAVVEVGGSDGYGSSIPLPDGGRGKAMMPIRVRSVAEGRFVVEGLKPGKTTVGVRARGLAPWQGEAEVLVDGGNELVVRLLPGVTLTGTVRDGDGKPVNRLSITVGRYDHLGYQRARTDTQGKYRLEGLPIGKLAVRASSGKLGKVETVLTAVAGQDLVWDPVLTKGLVVRGRVLDQHDKPVHQAMVEAHLEGSDRKIQWWAFEYTNKEGRFELKNCVPDRTFSMVVWGNRAGHGNKRLEGVKPEQGELVIRLPAGRKPSIFITGRVLDPQGKAVEACSITPYSREDRGGGVLITEAGTGRFKYGPYVPGDWQLRIDAKGYPLVRTPWRKVGKGETWDLGTIRLKRPGFLEVNLGASDTKLPKKMSFRILDAGREYLTRVSFTGRSARSKPLAPGTYYLQVIGGNLAVASHRFEIQADQDTPLNLAVQEGVPVSLEFEVPASEGFRPRSVVVTVTGSDGKPVLNTYAYRRRGAKNATLGFASRPGKYQVKASTEAGSRGQKTIQVGTEPGKPVRIVLR